MALFGEARDISLFRLINRELTANIISQEVVFYKCNLTETKTNMYGEASVGRVFDAPVIFSALVEVGDQTAPIQDNLVGFNWPITVKFLRDDLVDANVVPEIGDFIMWQDAYWEIDNVNDNQLFVGKDPAYPYNENPLNPGLDNFGTNLSVICTAHYVPADKVQITRERI